MDSIKTMIGLHGPGMNVEFHTDDSRKKSTPFKYFVYLDTKRCVRFGNGPLCLEYVEKKRIRASFYEMLLSQRNEFVM